MLLEQWNNNGGTLWVEQGNSVGGAALVEQRGRTVMVEQCNTVEGKKSILPLT